MHYKMVLLGFHFVWKWIILLTLSDHNRVQLLQAGSERHSHRAVWTPRGVYRRKSPRNYRRCEDFVNTGALFRRQQHGHGPSNTTGVLWIQIKQWSTVMLEIDKCTSVREAMVKRKGLQFDSQIGNFYELFLHHFEIYTC